METRCPKSSPLLPLSRRELHSEGPAKHNSWEVTCKPLDAYPAPKRPLAYQDCESSQTDHPDKTVYQESGPRDSAYSLQGPEAKVSFTMANHIHLVPVKTKSKGLRRQLSL